MENYKNDVSFVSKLKAEVAPAVFKVSKLLSGVFYYVVLLAAAVLVEHVAGALPEDMPGWMVWIAHAIANLMYGMDAVLFVNFLVKNFYEELVDSWKRD